MRSMNSNAPSTEMLKTVLKNKYHAAVAMLRQSSEKCGETRFVPLRLESRESARIKKMMTSITMMTRGHSHTFFRFRFWTGFAPRNDCRISDERLRGPNGVLVYCS